MVADSEGNFHRTRKVDTFDPFIGAVWRFFHCLFTKVRIRFFSAHRLKSRRWVNRRYESLCHCVEQDTEWSWFTPTAWQLPAIKIITHRRLLELIVFYVLLLALVCIGWFALWLTLGLFFGRTSPLFFCLVLDLYIFGLIYLHIKLHIQKANMNMAKAGDHLTKKK